MPNYRCGQLAAHPIADELRRRLCDPTGRKRKLRLRCVRERKNMDTQSQGKVPANRRFARAFDKELTHMIASSGRHRTHLCNHEAQVA